LHDSPKKEARVPPATAKQRASRARVQVTKYQNAKRLFADLEATAAANDAEIRATLQRVQQTDPVGDVLPCGRRMMFVPTASEARTMHRAVLQALADEGMDNYHAGAKAYRTRPETRNVSTIEANLRAFRADVKKRRLAEEEEST